MTMIAEALPASPEVQRFTELLETETLNREEAREFRRLQKQLVGVDALMARHGLGRRTATDYRALLGLPEALHPFLDVAGWLETEHGARPPLTSISDAARAMRFVRDYVAPYADDGGAETTKHLVACLESGATGTLAAGLKIYADAVELTGNENVDAVLQEIKAAANLDGGDFKQTLPKSADALADAVQEIRRLRELVYELGGDPDD